MEFNKFVRKPFIIEAIEITEENIDELAQYIGTLRKKEDGKPFIQVDRKLVPSIYRVFPGFWMTRMDGNIRCYSKKTFQDQFVETTPDIEQWVDFLNEEPVANGAVT